MEQMYNRRMLHRKDDRRRPGTCPAVAPGQGVYGVPEGVPNAVQPRPKKTGRSPWNPRQQKNKSRKCETYADSDRVRSATGTIC